MSDLDKNLITLELDKILSKVSDCAITDLGKSECLKIRPFVHKEEIEYELRLTTQTKKMFDESGSFGILPLDFIADCKSILQIIRMSATEIIACTRTLKNARLMSNFLLEAEDDLKEFKNKLFMDKALEDEIFSVFDDNLELKDSASEELKRLKNSLATSEEGLRNKISYLLSDNSFTEHLQDTIQTFRNKRTVFQVKASDKNKVRGIVHDVSASGQTFFIEPESLVPLNNKIQQLQSEIQAEIERILYALSEKLREIKTELINNQKILILLDVIFAKAKYSIKTQSTPAILKNEKIIKFQKARHPLLIGLIDNIVANDIEIVNPYNSLIISGSNTGGKTVVLKTIGLLIAMTKCGLHIPCLYAEIYPFKNIFANISEEQDILQSLSTFSAHIINVANIVNSACEFDLVLFDELCQGTDPMEGVSLARAILENLSDRNIITATTTHFGELKMLEYENPKFKNACVEFNKTTLKPTYKLIIGMAGGSNALDIAKNLNIKDEIINKAKEFLSSKGRHTSDVFNKIQEIYDVWNIKTQEIKEKEENIKKEEEALNKKLEEIKATKKKVVEIFKKKHQSQLENARAEIKETLDELRKEKSEKIARRSYAKLGKIEQEERCKIQKDEEEFITKFKEIDWGKIKKGDSVLVKDFNQTGIILEMPNSKNQVEVQIGLIKTTVDKTKLAKSLKKSKIDPSFNYQGSFVSRDYIKPEIDLRGMRVEDGLDALEVYLDHASLKTLSEITIIHGHGTGALRNAVREYLKTSPYVSKFHEGNGSDNNGVTVVYLK